MTMRNLSILLLLLSIPAAFAAGKAAKASSKSTEFYAVDIGHGNVTLVISPSGETMLLDCGPTRATSRIVDFMAQNGIKKIDYLFVTHFEDDHMGAAPGLSEKVPIVNWVDHGEDAVTSDKSDDWWKERRGPWWRPGIGKKFDADFALYKAARAKSHHIIVTPGDRVPIKGLEAIVVTGGGKTLQSPLKGGGQPNPACANVQLRHEDDAEDGQSLGILIQQGKFRFAYLGDMDWNPSYRLFCPTNKVGPVDVYLVTHHAQSMPRSMGDYYWGLSCCSEAEVFGLHPRVAVLSMGAEGHKQGDGISLETLAKSPGLESQWQTEKVTAGGEASNNAPDDYCANIGPPRSEKVLAIKWVARPDGGFSVINTRNGFTKDYPAKK
jgi:beta-lactamase superfamily II metal-dependent hydrolase